MDINNSNKNTKIKNHMHSYITAIQTKINTLTIENKHYTKLLNDLRTVCDSIKKHLPNDHQKHLSDFNKILRNTQFNIYTIKIYLYL